VAELSFKTYKSDYDKEENFVSPAGCGNRCVYLANSGAGRYGYSSGGQFYLPAAGSIVFSHGDRDRLVWSGVDISHRKRIVRVRR